MALTLVIGNKNYSSWSLRPWIAMKVAGLAFDERLIPLYELGSRERILSYSPAGKVPILIDGQRRVWESLAILEYLAEAFPAARLWPADAGARAHARAIAAEMHAGFAALRRACPMNLWLPPRPRPQGEDVMADVARIEAMWRDCRGALRARRSVPVRRLRRRRRDVCAGGGALPPLWSAGGRGHARLHGGRDGLAGLARMARGGASGALDHAAQRAGLASGARRPGRALNAPAALCGGTRPKFCQDYACPIRPSFTAIGRALRSGAAFW